MNNSLTIDVEDWFHILDSPAVPKIDKWPDLPLRAQASMEKILAMLDETGTKTTFFWLGWMAERFPQLVLKCQNAGHEIASHGYGHVLAYEVGRKAFAEDISRGKAILEDITGKEVIGFRAAGFSAKDDTPWIFEEVKVAGYVYDSSVFPTSRGHGGMNKSLLEPHMIPTEAGDLFEIPLSMIEIFGKRVSMFGGGYLRLVPQQLIEWGIRKLHQQGRPLVVYVHPREVDPDHPRLPLSPIRRFKSYINLKSTMPKLRWLCQKYKFITMQQMVEKLTTTSIELPKADF